MRPERPQQPQATRLRPGVRPLVREDDPRGVRRRLHAADDVALQRQRRLLFELVGFLHLECRGALPQLACDQVDQHLADQARLAGAGDAGDGDDHA